MKQHTFLARIYARYLRWRRRNASIFVLGGGPGAGKDTQAKIIAPKLQLPVVSTGDLCRREIAAGTKLGQLIEGYVKSGRLAPDKVIFELLQQELKQSQYYGGFILNGFPRTAAQAGLLDEMLERPEWLKPVAMAVMLEVPEPDLVERLSLRRTCTNKSCGRSFHLKFSPPAQADVCDACQSPLYQRVDDVPDTIRQRLSEYKATAQPLCDYYREKRILTVVKSTNAQSPDQVAAIVISAIKG
jgi:adenylate kinase